MRIHHHVSILLFVAIAGAIGLAVAVGVSLGTIERAARESGIAAGQYEHVERFVGDGRELLDMIDTLTLDSSEASFAIVHRSLERAESDLARLAQVSMLEEVLAVRDALDIVEEMIQQSSLVSISRAAGVLELGELQQFRRRVAIYVQHLEQVRDGAKVAATAQEGRLRLRRKIVMLFIGLICILYLALIERVRRWTTRRLIDPVQKLAEAAIRSMEGAEAFPGLEQGSAEELDTLARVLSSSADTIRAKDREQEHLEKEVAVRRRAEKQLRHAAFHDNLTGLCNRDLLLDRIEQCMERSRRKGDYWFAILFLDIDRFKEVNDSRGHLVGDQLLTAIADRLQSCLRGTDSLSRMDDNTIARIGGDEFVMLLDGIKERSDASVVAGRVQKVLAEPFRLHDQEVFITASIGIAFCEIDCEKADHLLRDADTAMYCAKTAGKARHEVFTKGMRDKAMARRQLGDDLRRAVELQEFRVAYQPIISLKTGRLSGFEALVRWQHPQRGEMAAVDFIDRAEETALIVQLGEWVVEEACRQLRSWQEEVEGGRELSVSVNLSKRQVGEQGLVEVVERVLRSTGIRGSDLKLEITESVIMENPDSIAGVLERLKQLGVEIHMDNFGTGYSSLSYLHRFPLDLVKIDRAFMSTKSPEHNYTDVIQTVVAMAHILNMRVTVQGVQTQEQVEQMIALGCDYAQGYFFSMPLDAAAAGRIIVTQPGWLESAA